MREFKKLDFPRLREYYTKYPQGYTLYESLLDILERINELTDVTNLTLKQWEQLEIWVLNELKKYSIEQLQAWLDDGTLEGVINEALFESKADKIELTKVISQLAQTVDKGELFINVKDYGALADGNTLDNQSILNAISAGMTGSTFLFPDGEYLVKDLQLEFPNESQVIFAGSFKVSNDAELFGVRIGSFNNRTKRVDLKGLKVYKETTDTESNLIGLSLVNFYESLIDIRRIEGFSKGLLLEAVENGFVYNEFSLGAILNNKINLDFKIGSNGWVNENSFIGGRFTWATSLDDVYGDGYIHIHIPHNEQHSINNNVFIKPSFEGGNNDTHALLINGNDNIFFHARYETPSKIELTDKSTNNVLFYGYDLLTKSIDNKGTHNKIFDRHGVSLHGGSSVKGVINLKTNSGNNKAIIVTTVKGEETFSVNGVGVLNANELSFSRLVPRITGGPTLIDTTENSHIKTIPIKDDNGVTIGYLPIYPSKT